MVYVPKNPEISRKFFGLFQFCKFKSGDNDTTYTYDCSCGDDYCESVYVKAFTGGDDSMEICFYNLV